MSSEQPAAPVEGQEVIQHEQPTVAAEPAAPPAPEEPQNQFTKEFTEKDWEGVRFLRSKLADIAKDVESDPLTLWGVELSPTKPTAKASVILVKFVRARPAGFEAAKDMLVATLKWRKEYKVEGITKEEFPEDVFGKVGVISGKDKGGRPVTYNFYGSTDPNVVFKDVDQFLRWRVALMEKGVALIDFETTDSMVQVHDYAGVSLMGGRTANSKAAAKQASQIFSDYYPELLVNVPILLHSVVLTDAVSHLFFPQHKKFFVSVPVVLTWIFWTFTSLLSPATQQKMSVVGSGPDTISAALLPVVDKDQLLKRYGGEGADI
ncbi:Non-classical phosphatidylinositol transfer protein (PITP) [Serendipita sp. 399]|nr:Non-classical phosphatidylinositol transfer protein (PITP) [Serendipita sp. 399]